MLTGATAADGRPTLEWRGLGFIAQSGLALKGVIRPWACKVFGTACTLETPIGTCMVSSEGACAAYYNFGRMHREAAVTLGRRP
jgi:hydrogenase expression/formation protein HypD